MAEEVADVIPLSTTTVTVSRPVQGVDSYETAVLTQVASGVAGHISAPSGADLHVGGDQENVSAVLLAECCADVRHPDLVTDDLTGETYEVVWVRKRIGLGLNHLKIGLRASKGLVSGGRAT